MDLLVRSINRLKKKQLGRTFDFLQLNHKLYHYDQKIKEDKNRLTLTFNDALIAKEKELTGFTKRVIELNNSIGSSKTRENEFIIKLKQKDKIISQLEAEKYDLMKTKKLHPHELYDDSKVII